MTLGPNGIFECPECGQLVKRGSLNSGNTCGATLYSDGKQVAPMLPKFPYIVKCRKCGTFIELNEKKKIGEESIGFFQFEDFEEEEDNQWKDVPGAEFLNVDEWTELINSQNQIFKDNEIYVRQNLWWAFNDRVREGKEMITSPDEKSAWEENAKRLMELFDPNIIRHKIMIAELHRNLGKFDECMSLINSLDSNEYEWVKKAFGNQCKSGNLEVFEFDRVN